MSSHSRLRYLVEYGLVRFGLRLARALGPHAAYRLGRPIGSLVYHVATKRRERAIENVRLAKDFAHGPGEVHRIAERSFHHMVGSALEAMAVLTAPDRLLLDDGYIHFERLDIADACVARGKGVIVALAHLGNWELAGLAAPKRGYRLISVARPMKNPMINEFLVNARGMTGQEIVPKKGASDAMAGVLRDRGILVLLCDQRWRHGVAVDFFGRPAATVPTPAILALRYGSPILPLEVYRQDRPPYHVAICRDPIEPAEYRGKPEAIHRLTQDLTRRLEEFVRRHPEQWLWMHNRWRTWKEHRRGRAGI